MEQITADTYYTAILPGIAIALPVLYVALAILWNRKWVPRQRQRGQATPPFGKVVGDYLSIGFKESTFSLLPKKVDNRKLRSLLSLKTINWLLVIATIAMLGTYANDIWINAWIPVVALLLSVWVAASPLINARKAVLSRMFSVAGTVFRYGRGAELTPWRFIKIKKWQGQTPTEIHISIPPEYDASSPVSRDGFERHFNGTVTDENTWVYEWQSAKGVVIARPIADIPTMVPYEGSEKYKWHQIPLGMGVNGDVVVDLTLAPHMLITGVTGSGKSLDLDTPILTTDGWKTIGTLKEGDLVYGTDGNTYPVTHLHPVITPAKAYKVKFRNGESLIVDAHHLWETLSKKDVVDAFEGKEDNVRRWLNKRTVDKLIKEYETSTPDETITIPELKELTGLKTSSALYKIGKQVGVAELVRKTVQYGYNLDTVTSAQKFVAVDKDEFIHLFNNRKITPTVKYPLTHFMFEKLNEYAVEVRSDDTVTFQDIISYTGGDSQHNRLSVKWFEDNLDFSKDAPTMLADAVEKAKTKANPFPTKIFNIESDDQLVTFEDIILLVPMGNREEVKNMFFRLSKKATSKTFTVREISRFFPTGATSSTVVETYPKKVFLKAVLAQAGYKTDNVQMGGVITTEQMLENFVSDSYLYKGDTLQSSNHYIRTTKPTVGVKTELPVGPYTLGAYLGDGYSSSGTICGEDEEVIENILNEGSVLKRKSYRKGYANDFFEVTFEGLSETLRANGLAHRANRFNKYYGQVKHIPDMYLNSDEESRRALLRGLMDTDGSVKSDGRVVFSNTNKTIIDNVITLVSSLGYVPHIEESRREQEKARNYKDVFHVIFSANPEDKIFGLTRKLETHTARHNADIPTHMLSYHKIVSIEEVTPVPMRCISVGSEDRLFLVGRSLIPTHNSVLQRNLIFHCIQHNDMWRFLGVDIKRVELSPFKKYQQTVMGIGTNLEDGVDIVRYVKRVMEKRYEKMEAMGINNFKDMKDESGKTDYAIMLMIDEAYMFMAPTGNKSDEGKAHDQLHAEASSMLGEIARLGRAAGIHLVMATQRPDAKVIYGELKLNLPIRIAAGRLDSTASAMTLDTAAATFLPAIKGRGIVSVYGEAQQFQGYYADQDWIDKWLEQHPGVEPTLFPEAGKGSQLDSTPGDLGEMMEAGGFDFEDEQSDYDVNAETGETDSPLEMVKEFIPMPEEVPAPQVDNDFDPAPADFTHGVDVPLPGLEDENLPALTQPAQTPPAPAQSVPEASGSQSSEDDIDPELLKLIQESWEAGESDKPVIQVEQPNTPQQPSSPPVPPAKPLPTLGGGLPVSKPAGKLPPLPPIPKPPTR